jgi:arabinofuranosyltransferase
MSQNRIALSIIGVAALFALVVLAFFPNRTIDDAYVTYRYAENLAHHGELTYNAGGLPVEGYTGVALPVLLAGAVSIGLSPETVSKVIGVLSFFLCGLFLFLLGRRLGFRPTLNAIVVLLYFTLPIGFTHTLAGLETPLFAAGIAGSLLTLIRAAQEKARPGRPCSPAWSVRKVSWWRRCAGWRS